jgi:hypothetical protein
VRQYIKQYRQLNRAVKQKLSKINVHIYKHFRDNIKTLRRNELEFGGFLHVIGNVAAADAAAAERNGAINFPVKIEEDKQD